MRRSAWAARPSAPPRAGIAPFYSDKYAKIGIQVCDLFDEDRLRERSRRTSVELKNVLFEHLYHKPPLDADELFERAAWSCRDRSCALCGRRRAPLCTRL